MASETRADLVARLPRYDLITNYRAGGSIEEVERSEDGDWVRWDDLRDAIAVLSRGEGVQKYTERDGKGYCVTCGGEVWTEAGLEKIRERAKELTQAFGLVNPGDWKVSDELIEALVDDDFEALPREISTVIDPAPPAAPAEETTHQWAERLAAEAITFDEPTHLWTAAPAAETAQREDGPLEQLPAVGPMGRPVPITRVEVIGPTGRVLVANPTTDVQVQYQDGFRTLKVFIGTEPQWAGQSAMAREAQPAAGSDHVIRDPELGDVWAQPAAGEPEKRTVPCEHCGMESNPGMQHFCVPMNAIVRVPASPAAGADLDALADRLVSELRGLTWCALHREPSDHCGNCGTAKAIIRRALDAVSGV